MGLSPSPTEPLQKLDVPFQQAFVPRDPKAPMHKKEEDPFLGTLLEETTLCYTIQQIGPGWLARIGDTDVTLCTQAGWPRQVSTPRGAHSAAQSNARGSYGKSRSGAGGVSGQRGRFVRNQVRLGGRGGACQGKGLERAEGRPGLWPRASGAMWKSYSRGQWGSPAAAWNTAGMGS